MIMIGTHDLNLVFLSVFVAIFASGVGTKRWNQSTRRTHLTDE